MLRSALKWYQQKLSFWPVRTQVVTSGILWGTGDFLAQKIDQSMQAPSSSSASGSRLQSADEGASSTLSENGVKNMHKSSINFKRLITTTLFGISFVGPIGHYWYSHLDIVVTRALLLRPGTASFIGAKVAADTFIFGPVHLIAFFSWTGLASGKTWSQVKSDIVRDFIPAFVTESTVWPAVQVANFKFVPVQHQLLLVNSVCLLDSAWLSWLKYQEDAPWKQLLQSYFRRK